MFAKGRLHTARPDHENRALLHADLFPGTNDLRLLAPADLKIYYDPELNPALLNNVYRLRDWNGTADAGGVLRPVPIPGTVVILK